MIQYHSFDVERLTELIIQCLGNFISSEIEDGPNNEYIVLELNIRKTINNFSKIEAWLFVNSDKFCFFQGPETVVHH